MIKNRLLRFILLVIGFLSLGLGLLGIILPILPTVPFLLLTSFCFVRSSEKFNHWFLNSKIYKKHIECFAKNKAMTLRGELTLLLLVSTMLITTIMLVNNLAVTIVLTTLICLKYLYFVVNITPVTKEMYLKMQEENHA